jgi:membrane associated rhomboid family serine protease
MGSIIDKARQGWLTSSMLMRLVWINIIIFLVIHIGAIICNLCGFDYTYWIQLWTMPSSLSQLALRPWTVLTYMFAQYEVLHILFNMLWLYWFGSIFMQFSTPRQLVGLYLYGGIVGALVFFVGYNIFPGLVYNQGWLIGSSASVIAIVIATAMMRPDMSMRLLFLGEVKLKWIAVGAVVIFLIGLSGDNIGGHLAHIGGGLVGLYYGMMMRRGIDITNPINRTIDCIVNAFNGIKNVHPIKVKKYKAAKKATGETQRPSTASTSSSSERISKEDQEELDKILDKVKKSGYTALSAEEKRRLFDVSKRIR